MKVEDARTPAERVSDTDRMLEEMSLAVQEAVERHRRLGHPIAVWRNEQVEWIQPEDIPVLGEYGLTGN